MANMTRLERLALRLRIGKRNTQADIGFHADSSRTMLSADYMPGLPVAVAAVVLDHQYSLLTSDSWTDYRIKRVGAADPMLGTRREHKADDRSDCTTWKSYRMPGCCTAIGLEEI